MKITVNCYDCGKKLSPEKADCIERNGNLIHVCLGGCKK